MIEMIHVSPNRFHFKYIFDHNEILVSMLRSNGQIYLKMQGSVFVFELNSLKLSSDCFSAIFPIECSLVFDYFAVELQLRYGAYRSCHGTCVVRHICLHSI